MKKKKQLGIRKLSLSKKTISFLDASSSAQIMGGTDIYGPCTGMNTCDGNTCAASCLCTVHNQTCPPYGCGGDQGRQNDDSRGQCAR